MISERRVHDSAVSRDFARLLTIHIYSLTQPFTAAFTTESKQLIEVARHAADPAASLASIKHCIEAFLVEFGSHTTNEIDAAARDLLPLALPSAEHELINGQAPAQVSALNASIIELHAIAQALPGPAPSPQT